MVEELTKVPGKKGRPPYPASRRRPRFAVRFAPETTEFLRAMLPGLPRAHRNMGRAVDLCVKVLKDTGIDPSTDLPAD